MTSIINEIYRGQFCPESQLYRTKAYQRIHRELCAINDAFEDSLSPEQSERFQVLMDETYGLTEHLSSQKFYIGFCMGARIMLEVLQFDTQ